jgi:hypothetical protein
VNLAIILDQQNCPHLAYLEKFLYLELLAKLLKNKEVVIPGKRSATRNPGFSSSSGFRLSPE